MYSHPLNRRAMLYAGWLAGAGLTLGDALKLQAGEKGNSSDPSFGKAKSVIHIYLQGGFAQPTALIPSLMRLRSTVEYCHQNLPV